MKASQNKKQKSKKRKKLQVIPIIRTTDPEPIKKKPYERLFGNQFNLKYDIEYIERLADEMMQWFSEKDGELIWLRDFAIEKGIGNQRISEFAEKNDYFKYILTLCKEKQESILFKLGLKIKTAMPIFALKNCSGWKDKKEIGFDEETITAIEVLIRKAK